MPIPFAASTTALFTWLIPVKVLRIIGRKAYSIKATIAGLAPMPNSGIIKPNNAILGMVCSIPAMPKTQLLHCFFRAIQMPNGMPISTDSNRLINVRPICANVWSSNLSCCCHMKLHKVCCLSSMACLNFIC